MYDILQSKTLLEVRGSDDCLCRLEKSSPKVSLINNHLLNYLHHPKGPFVSNYSQDASH